MSKQTDEPEVSDVLFGSASGGRGRAWLVLMVMLTAAFVIAALLGYFRL